MAKCAIRSLYLLPLVLQPKLYSNLSDTSGLDIMSNLKYFYVVSLYFITLNQDAEAISDDPEILSGGRSESRYHTADAEIETSIDGVSCGDGVFHSHQGEVWGGCHAHCPAKFLIFSLSKGLILVKFEWFD